MSKNGKFLYLVTSKRKFEGYLRFEFIKSSYIFLVALHWFCFIKIVSKIPNFQFFYFENSLWWLLWVNASSHFQRICSGTRYGNSKLIWNSYTVKATLFCFLFRIMSQKWSNFKFFFLPQKTTFVGHFVLKACTHFQKIWT